MIIENPIYCFMFISNCLMLVAECYLLRNEIRKCRKRANKEKLSEESKKDLSANKLTISHHALINKKLPMVKLKSIKTEIPKTKELKANNFLSLKFTLTIKNNKEVKNNEFAETRRIEQARSTPF